MYNLITFFNAFLSYLFVYIIFGVCIVAAVFAGIAFRKNKDKKNATKEADAVTE